MRFQLLCLAITGSCLAGDPVEIRLRQVNLVDNTDIRLRHVASVSDSSLAQIDVAKIRSGKAYAIIDKSTISIRLRLHGLKLNDFRLVGPEQIMVSLRPPIAAADTHELKDVSSTSFSAEDHSTFHRISMRNPSADQVISLPPPPELLAKKSNSDDQQMNLLSLTRLPTVRHSTVSRSLAQSSPDDATIEQAVRESLAEQFGIAALDLQVRLLRPLSTSDLKTIAEATRIETIAPSAIPLGRHPLTVQFWNDRRLLAGKTFQVDVRRRQEVMVARRPIVRGRVALASDMRTEIRWLDMPYDSVQRDELISLVSKRTLRAGSLLKLEDFEEPRPSQPRSINVIRARDAVRIVGRRKGLEFVVPNAEALQAGRAGQMIRVRNVQSGKIIIARVVGPGEVEVSLE